jgi:hypothetical protein
VNGGLEIYDISSPATGFVALGRYTSVAPNATDITSVGVKDTCAVVTNGEAVEVVDVSSLDHPILAGSADIAP